MTTMQSFVSYSAPEEAVAVQLTQDLEAEGLSAWCAPSGLQGGDRLSDIHARIAEARYLLFLLSRSSLNSKWVQHEVNIPLALQLDGKAIDVIPLLLEPVERPAAVADLVSIDFRTNNREQGLVEILHRLGGASHRKVASIALAFRDFLESLVVLPDKIVSEQDRNKKST